MTGADPTPVPLSPGADPLAALRDWHLPEPISWWPPAPGWWVLGGLILILMVIAVRWWGARRRRSAPARAALAELEALSSRLANGSGQRHDVAAVSILLRRLALARYPRDQVAGLTGPAWLAFLDRTGGADAFTQGPGQVLIERPYRPTGHCDPETPWDPAGLTTLAVRWIRAHWEPRP